MVNDVSASSGVSSPEQVVNSIQKQSFRWRFILKCLLFPHFLLFLVLKRDFIRRVDFTRNSASNKASDDVTKYVTNRIFNTDLVYSFAHFCSQN